MDAGPRKRAEAEFRPLGLSTRIINLLCLNGIFTVGDLRRLTERQVSQISGLGPSRLAKLRPFLRKGGPPDLPATPKFVRAQFQPRLLRRVDAWAAENLEPGKPRSEAIRQLVEHGLTCHDMAKRKKKR